MQTPERLAIIGGSILLSSTLVFTLKSQAATLLPNISNSASQIYDHIGDTQKSIDFDHNFSNAQSSGKQTGSWGTAPYYIDEQSTLHIGSGQPQGQLSKVLASQMRNQSADIKAISFDQPIQAPTNSFGLLSDFTSITTIHGLNQMDMTKVQDMTLFFSNDSRLTDLDLSSWQTPDLTKMDNFFGNTEDLKNVDLGSLDTSHASTNAWLLYHGGQQLHTIHLGAKTYLKGIGYLPDGTWKNGDNVLNADQLRDGQAHPGTWTKQ